MINCVKKIILNKLFIIICFVLLGILAVFIIFAMIVIITFKNDIAYSKVKDYVSKNKKVTYRIRFLDKILSFIAYVDSNDKICIKNSKGSKIFKGNDDYFVVKSIKNEFFKAIKNHMNGKKEILSIYDLKYNTDLERLDRAFKRISDGTMLK